ncbi:MAG: glutathionylspermidine synthase family protein [Candidatus Omnitrophica bacterium]|nr:glutathionylspermidine synthase family protein [Candidatus Omnitrophota bacterium]
MVQRTSIDYTRNTDHAFEQYVLSNEKVLAEAIRRFEDQLHHSLVKFGRFTIPTFFKPHFITAKQTRLIHAASDHLARMVDRLADLYLHNDPILKDCFSLSQEAEELVRIDPGYARVVVLARFDCTLEGETLKFMELNCDSPAGMGYTDTLEQLFFESKELTDFFDEIHVQREMRSQKLLDALLSIYEDFGGVETPQIAIVDWKTVRTRPEFDILKSFFESKGYKTTIADPRELRYKSGKLYHGNFRIDLLYRRVIFNELLEKLREVNDLVRAYKDRAVCVVNPLRSRLAASKAILSILTNPGYDHLFSAKENETKQQHVLWTRRMIDADRFYGGKKIYFVDFLKDEKESLVLKPAEGYGGKEVTIGPETRDDEWNHTIDKAIKSNWVVQEFVSPPVMTVPTIVNHKIEFVAKKVNTGCFVFNGAYAGSLSRLSDETVVNVSRGGGLVPTVACESEINR